MPPPSGSRFKTALVDCGRIGERLAHILASSSESRLVGLVDKEFDLEGRKSLEVITAIDESIESGREVKFPFTPAYSRLGRPEGEPGLGTRDFGLESKR